MRALFGILLVLVIALIAASPPVLMASVVTANDQDAATAYVAIMTDAISQNADMMTQANPAYTENTIPANMAITTKEEALIAPELVSGMEYRSYMINSYAIATTETGGKEVGAMCACYRSKALPCSPG